jgi:hypothetical protein
VPEPIHFVVTSKKGHKGDKRLRVLETFETPCTVTQSVGQGIPVTIKFIDSQGQILKWSSPTPATFTCASPPRPHLCNIWLWDGFPWCWA